MDRCTSCGRDVVPTWKFCSYCGRPLVLAAQPRATVIPGAIRADPAGAPARTNSRALWGGVILGTLGLAVIIYTAVIVYGSHV